MICFSYICIPITMSIKLNKMNFNLSQIPERNIKPREHGITMVMDKGLSVEEAKNFMSATHPHVDVVKLGFGTSYVTPNLKEKLEVYRSFDMPIYSRASSSISAL